MGYLEDLKKNRDKLPTKGVTEEQVQKLKDKLLKK